MGAESLVRGIIGIKPLHGRVLDCFIKLAEPVVKTGTKTRNKYGILNKTFGTFKATG